MESTQSWRGKQYRKRFERIQAEHQCCLPVLSTELDCYFHCSHVLQITYMISRKRSEFGAPIKFSDQNASSVKDAYIECTAYPDNHFTLKQLEKDVGMQVIPKVKDISTQTRW